MFFASSAGPHVAVATVGGKAVIKEQSTLVETGALRASDSSRISVRARQMCYVSALDRMDLIPWCCS